MSAAEGMFSAPSATSCACEAFSRASNARPMAPVSSGLSSRSESALPEPVLGVRAQPLAQVLGDVARIGHPSAPVVESEGANPRRRRPLSARDEGYGALCPSACSCSSSSSSPGCSARPRPLPAARGRGRRARSAWSCSARSTEAVPAAHARLRARPAPSCASAGAERGIGRPVSAEPAAVSTTRATVIDPVSLSAENQARAWLEELDREREVLAATAVLNRVVHAHRVAAADPYVHEVSPEQALVIRAGWGEGEQVADGAWLHARELPWRVGGAPARRAPASARRRCVPRSASRLCSAGAPRCSCARSSCCGRGSTSTRAAPRTRRSSSTRPTRRRSASSRRGAAGPRAAPGRAREAAPAGGRAGAGRPGRRGRARARDAPSPPRSTWRRSTRARAPGGGAPRARCTWV